MTEWELGHRNAPPYVLSLHINNCFKEGELDKGSVVKDFATTASDG